MSNKALSIFTFFSLAANIVFGSTPVIRNTQSKHDLKKSNHIIEYQGEDFQCFSLEIKIIGGVGKLPEASTPNCAGDLYIEGSVVHLTAIPGDGFSVYSWEGTDDDSSTEYTNTVTITSDRKVQIHYIEDGDPHRIVDWNSPGGIAIGPELISVETVIGSDDRAQITYTTDAPWRRNALLEITFPSTSGGCTGWFVGPHTVITSGHCVYNSSYGGWATSIKVIPGKDGSTEPYGYQWATSISSVSGWTSSGLAAYDYGSITLPDDTMGNQVGWYRYGYYSDSYLSSISIANLAGYPGDKPYGTQWYDTDPVAQVDPNIVSYAIDTANGQSGSGVWYIGSDNNYVVAIHGYGTGSSSCATGHNCGPRITQGVANNISDWGAATAPDTDCTTISTPTLYEPAHQASLHEDPILFDWSDVSNNDGYQYQLWNSDFSNLIRDVDTSSSYYEYPGLGNGTYYWRARAYSNQNGCPDGEFSTFWEVNVIDPPADEYEPDDTSGTANWIYNGSPQTHSIVPTDDVDWVKFSLSDESGVVLETSGPSGDTRMWLYNSSLNEIEYDDDGGSNTFSRIDRLCGDDALPPGTYFIKIDEYGNNNEITSYNIDFTIVETCTSPPGSFNKSSPSNGATGLSTSPTISWGSSSGADSYEYCYDTSNNSSCDSSWISTSSSTSTSIGPLSNSTTYYWQVRARNVSGDTYANNGTWWSFTTEFQPVQANFSATPRSGIKPIPVSFTNLSLGDLSTCNWDFGDGTTSTECLDPEHTYETAGVFSVSLTVSGSGGEDTETKSGYITVYEPVTADFSASPTSGVAPLTVNFTNLSDGDYDTCSWDFGDGGSSNSCGDPSHTYNSAGTYTVSLTVSGNGGSDTEIKNDYIQGPVQTALLQIDPASTTVNISSTVTVDILVTEVTDLYGAALTITFDPTKLEVVDADPEEEGVQIIEGSCPEPNFVVANAADNTTGTIQYDVASLSPSPPCNGSGIIASIEFHGLEEPSSDVIFSEWTLSNTDGESIPANAQNGNIVVEGMGFVEGYILLQGRSDESGAEVCVNGTCMTTGADGYYSISVPEGTYTVQVEMPLYLDSTKSGVYVAAGSTVTLANIELPAGDVNDDGLINIQDLSFIGFRYGRNCGDPDWDPQADLNIDCTVNIQDVAVTGGNYLEESPVPWPD